MVDCQPQSYTVLLLCSGSGGASVCVIRPGRSPVCARDPRTSPILVLALRRRSAERVPRSLGASTIGPHFGLPTARPCFASCTSSPTNNAPASQPACTQEQGSPARPQAYLRSAKLWDRAAQRSVPGHGLFDSPLHHRARARGREREKERETERQRDRERAQRTHPATPSSHPCAYRSAQPSEYLQRLTATGARRLSSETAPPDTALAVRRTRIDSTCSMPGSGM